MDLIPFPPAPQEQLSYDDLAALASRAIKAAEWEQARRRTLLKIHCGSLLLMTVSLFVANLTNARLERTNRELLDLAAKQNRALKSQDGSVAWAKQQFLHYESVFLLYKVAFLSYDTSLRKSAAALRACQASSVFVPMRDRSTLEPGENMIVICAPGVGCR